jgi:hypothetical protein
MRRLLGETLGIFPIAFLQFAVIYWTWGASWFFTSFLILSFFQSWGQQESEKTLAKDWVTLGFGYVVVGLGLWLFRCYLILLDPQLEHQGIFPLDLFKFALNVVVNMFKLVL